MKNTKGLIVADYFQLRSRIIEETLNMTKSKYPKDNSMLGGVIDLTVALEVAEPNTEFVQDLWGFMQWANQTNQTKGVLTTIIHDLGEFARNRNESWFCPRSSGYRKYLTGASGSV